MRVTPTELKQKLEAGESMQILDVRSPGEFNAGHVPGAVNIPLEQVESRLADLRGSEPVVLVCQSGRRAEMCKELIEHHRDDLIVLEGGTSAWVKAGFETVGSSASRWAIERQVRLAAGLLVLTGTALSVFVNPSWVYLAMFVGAGLTFAGLTNVCGMAALFAAMPWNKSKKSVTTDRLSAAR